jgi:hypothetical protein
MLKATVLGFSACFKNTSVQDLRVAKTPQVSVISYQKQDIGKNYLYIIYIILGQVYCSLQPPTLR